MTERKRYRHERQLQIMPADGWWMVFANSDGSLERSRVVAFALIESWSSTREDEIVPDDDNRSVSRTVSPLLWQDGYIDTDEALNSIALVHADEWAQEEVRIQKLAKEWAEKNGEGK